jgi:hypothetical protein
MGAGRSVVLQRQSLGVTPSLLRLWLGPAPGGPAAHRARLSLLRAFEAAVIAYAFEEVASFTRNIGKYWGACLLLVPLAEFCRGGVGIVFRRELSVLLQWPYSRIKARERRPIPAGDVAVLGVVALDQEPLARPASNQRRLRTVIRRVAAAGAQTSATIALRGLGRLKAISPSLMPQSIWWASRLSSASIHTGWWYCPIGGLLERNCSDPASPLNCC